MSHPYRLIAFDFDGTLVDSQSHIVAAMAAAFAAHGLAAPEAPAVRRVVGLALEQAIARLLPETAAPDAAARLARAYREAFLELRAGTDYEERLFPGVRETLRLLDRPEVCLGIVTGKGRRGLMSSLERHGLDGHFVTLQTADDGPSKPHPALLERALAEVGAAPREAVLVGDTSYDMMMAKSAGVDAIGVAWGYHPPAELLAHGAAQVIAAFAELPPSLARLAEEGACD